MTQQVPPPPPTNEEKDSPPVTATAWTVWVLTQHARGHIHVTIFSSRASAQSWLRAQEAELLRWCIEAKFIWHVSLTVSFGSTNTGGGLLAFSSAGPNPPNTARGLDTNRSFFCSELELQRVQGWWQELRPDTVWDDSFHLLCHREGWLGQLRELELPVHHSTSTV